MPPAVDRLETDITLPVGPLDAAMSFVDDAVGRGFRTLKIKIGGHELADDIALVRDIHTTFPDLQLVLDANGAYDLDTARRLLRSLDGVPLALLEQPLPRDALDDMAALQTRDRRHDLPRRVACAGSTTWPPSAGGRRCARST